MADKKITHQDKKIVCLGGGIGTVNLLKGLHAFTKNLTVIVFMADEGGSAGRLRRLYNTMPPGDIVSCMKSLLADQEKSKLYGEYLTYRFPGDRYGKDHELGGHKLGNLMLFAAQEITGSFTQAIKFMQQLFGIDGNILPATEGPVTIDARTVERKIIKGEEKIDLGKYKGKRVLDHVYLHPRDAKASSLAIQALKQADIIIAGPGDLYTTILPVLIIPEINELLLHLKKNKIFIVNVANKPFETKGYRVPDFVNAIEKHLGAFPFDEIIVNNNFSLPIPQPYNYSYTLFNEKELKEMEQSFKVIASDLIDDNFPLYHSSEKLASLIEKKL